MYLRNYRLRKAYLGKCLKPFDKQHVKPYQTLSKSAQR